MFEIMKIIDLQTTETYVVEIINKSQYDKEMFRHDNNNNSLYLKAYISDNPTTECYYAELPKKIFKKQQRTSDTNKFHRFINFLVSQLHSYNNSNEIKIIYMIDNSLDFCDFLEKYYCERKK